MERLDTKRQIPISIIMCDVNGLKIINDSYGHKKGDQILKEIAAILDQFSDNNKIAAHLCADHFAVILKNQSSSELEKILNLIKEKLSAININGIYIDIAAVSLQKINKNIDAYDFLNDGVSKINLNKFTQFIYIIY